MAHQSRDRPAGADTEVPPGDDDVALLDFRDPAGAQVVEDVLGRLRNVHLHGEARVHGIGIDAVAEYPRPAGVVAVPVAVWVGGHANAFLGSVIWPVMAEAATVAVEAM
jgi:hypothetical protein